MMGRAFDPDRAWQTRADREAAERAMKANRRERNVRLVTMWVEVLGTVTLAVLFVVGLFTIIRSGLFAWLVN